jgi:hypothetical protein
VTLRVVDQGVVAWRPAGAPGLLRVGPRLVVRDDGSLLCSYMTQSALGVADFTPTLAESDDGHAWQEIGPVWGDDDRSLFCNLSRSPDGLLVLYGSATVVDVPGESFWSPETQGLKANQLVWSRSLDWGKTWSELTPIPMPGPEAAEVAGSMCVARDGTLLACYAPSNTFDPALHVDRARVVLLRSIDGGTSWAASDMIRLEPRSSQSAEAWVVELAGGRLVGACWHIGGSGPIDPPNAYSISDDGGLTWSPTGTTGTRGQSISLTPLRDGTLALQYNRRRDEAGVWLAIARPSAGDFGIVEQVRVWKAAIATRHDSGGDHTGWTDFAFGEPASAELPDGDLLVVLWCDQPDGSGIRFVRIRR